MSNTNSDTHSQTEIADKTDTDSFDPRLAAIYRRARGGVDLITAQLVQAQLAKAELAQAEAENIQAVHSVNRAAMRVAMEAAAERAAMMADIPNESAGTRRSPIYRAGAGDGADVDSLASETAYYSTTEPFETYSTTEPFETVEKPFDILNVNEVVRTIQLRSEERDKLIEKYESKLKWKLFLHRITPFKSKCKNFDEENIEAILKIAYLKSQK